MRYSTICMLGCAIQDGADQVSGIGWEQGTDFGAGYGNVCPTGYMSSTGAPGERKLNALSHLLGREIHFVYKRAASGRGVPLLLTHGWPGSSSIT